MNISDQRKTFEFDSRTGNPIVARINLANSIFSKSVQVPLIMFDTSSSWLYKINIYKNSR